jgi:hypothetical protein
MITINKRIFQTPSTIPKMVEQIVLQGMLEETNFRMEEIKLSADQVKWIEEFTSLEGHVVHLNGERCSGRTSIGIGMVLATALFKSDSSSLVMASNEQMMKYHQRKLLEYLRTFCEIFSLTELVSFKNRNTIELINGSRIYFRVDNKSDNFCAFRGLTLDNTFIDLFNVHTMEDLNNDMMAAMLPCIYHTNGKLIVSLGG